MKRRVAFVLYRYPLGVSPMIINSVSMFARHGYGVDVFIDDETLASSPIGFDEPDVRILQYGGARNLFVRAWELIMGRLAARLRLFERAARSLPLSLVIPLLFPRMALFARWMRGHLGSSDYEYVMPVECSSLLSVYGVPLPERLIYYNMELLDWSRDNPLYEAKLVLKHLEFRMLAVTPRVVIQSPQRAALFAEINKYDPRRIGILRVATMGEAVAQRSRHFRDRFGLSDETSIVVYSGNFLPWAQCVEIIESVRGWPEGCALVMHTWNRGALHSDYFREMQAAAEGLTVHFSADYIAYEDLAPALSSGDMGVLFYEAIDGNFTEILFSSNKLAEYLKAGLPVICSDYPSLREFVTSEGIGVAVASPAGMPAAVATIRADLQGMRERARKCYEREFRFERQFEKFLRFLSATAESVYRDRRP